MGIRAVPGLAALAVLRGVVEADDPVAYFHSAGTIRRGCHEDWLVQAHRLFEPGCRVRIADGARFRGAERLAGREGTVLEPTGAAEVKVAFAPARRGQRVRTAAVGCAHLERTDDLPADPAGPAATAPSGAGPRE